MSNAKYKVILMRGISGSGKSTYCQENFPDATICSADHFFISPTGEYKFDRSKLGAAHASCKEKFNKALQAREKLIVVDNTNTMLREMTPYVKEARYRGYRVECIRIDIPVDVAFSRNQHNVPYQAIKAMFSRMEDVPREWNEKVVKYES